MDHQQLPDNEASRSAVQVSSDHELRVACYCEENVYRLVYRKLKQNKHNADGDNYYVMFVSSESLCVPMYYQRAAARPTAPCLWDYHVLVLHADPQQRATILDVDSLLPYPTPLHDYDTQTFPSGTIHRDYAPLFRVIRASAFLKNFYSDRMHMFSEGKWSAPPPNYACIQTNKGSNLDSYRIMTWVGEEQLDDSMFDLPYGTVLNREQLMRRFGNAREGEIK